MSTCESCPNRDRCQIRAPLDTDGDRPYYYLRCAYYSCTEGRDAASASLTDSTPKVITLADGTTIKAVVFGTCHKPTHLPGAAVTRMVDIRSGSILGSTSEGFKPTGQRVAVNVRR